MIRIDTAAPAAPAHVEPLPWDETPAATPGENIPGEILNPTVEPMALVTVEPAKVDHYFTTPGALTPMLEALAAHVRAIPRDVSTRAGREAVASLAFKVAKSKTYLDGIGKELTDELKEKPKRVDAARKSAREFLDALRDEVRQPLTNWETMQEEQNGALAYFARLPEDMAHATPAGIAQIITQLQDPLPLEYDRLEELDPARLQAIAALEALHSAALQREADAADLARLRAAEATRVAEEARKAEEARIAREATEKAQRDAQEALDRAAREKADAEQRAADAEARAEKDRKDAADRAERERIASEERTRKATEEATAAERLRAEQAQQEADRKAKAEKAEADRKAADVEHQRTFNREAWADIQGIILAQPKGNDSTAEETATAILTAIYRRQVRHIAITY